MKSPKMVSMPWDMVVFLSITAVGFGFSVQKLKTNPLRQPARDINVVHGSLKPDVASHDESLFDLGCVEEKLSREKVTSHVGEIRFKGRFCQISTKAMKNFGGVRVRNLTTGKEGTIFLRGLESMFVTDALLIGAGRNEIQIEWRSDPDAQAKTLIAEIYGK